MHHEAYDLSVCSVYYIHNKFKLFLNINIVVILYGLSLSSRLHNLSILANFKPLQLQVSFSTNLYNIIYNPDQLLY